MPDRVEKVARALDDAIDNALIAWGMGWDMDGVMACLKEAKDEAALAAAEVETQPVGWQFAAGQTVEKFTGEAIWHGVIVARYLTTKGKQRYVVEVQPQGFQMIAVPNQLRASPPIRDEAEIRRDEREKMLGELENRLERRMADLRDADAVRHTDIIVRKEFSELATAIRARGET